MDDDLRAILSRWRLSNHKLKIETGRYTVPITPRAERKCAICNTLEDESHAIFYCPRTRCIRAKYAEILAKYMDINAILNPDLQDAITVAKFVKDIDDIINQ